MPIARGSIKSSRALFFRGYKTNLTLNYSLRRGKCEGPYRNYAQDASSICRIRMWLSTVRLWGSAGDG